MNTKSKGPDIDLTGIKEMGERRMRRWWLRMIKGGCGRGGERVEKGRRAGTRDKRTAIPFR